MTSGATARLRRQGRNAVDRRCGAYEAFGKGDISAILDKLDENVAWDTQAYVPGIPWLSPRRQSGGRAEHGDTATGSTRVKRRRLLVGA